MDINIGQKQIDRQIYIGQILDRQIERIDIPTLDILDILDRNIKQLEEIEEIVRIVNMTGKFNFEL